MGQGELRNPLLPEAKEQAGTQFNLEKLILGSPKDLKASLNTFGGNPCWGDLIKLNSWHKKVAKKWIKNMQRQQIININPHLKSHQG